MFKKKKVKQVSSEGLVLDEYRIEEIVSANPVPCTHGPPLIAA